MGGDLRSVGGAVKECALLIHALLQLVRDLHAQLRLLRVAHLFSFFLNSAPRAVGETYLIHKKDEELAQARPIPGGSVRYNPSTTWELQA